MKLFLCGGCNRHIKEADATCPFCGVGVRGALVGDSSIRVPRMSRTLMLTGAAVGAAVALAMVSCSGETYGGCPACPHPDAFVPFDAPNETASDAAVDAMTDASDSGD